MGLRLGGGGPALRMVVLKGRMAYCEPNGDWVGTGAATVAHRIDTGWSVDVSRAGGVTHSSRFPQPQCIMSTSSLRRPANSSRNVHTSDDMGCTLHGTSHRHTLRSDILR